MRRMTGRAWVQELVVTRGADGPYLQWRLGGIGPLLSFVSDRFEVL